MRIIQKIEDASERRFLYEMRERLAKQEKARARAEERKKTNQKEEKKP